MSKPRGFKGVPWNANSEEAFRATDDGQRNYYSCVTPTAVILTGYGFGITKLKGTTELSNPLCSFLTKLLLIYSVEIIFCERI